MDAETILRQSIMTADCWLDAALDRVKNLPYSYDAKSKIVAAYIRAAATDQFTMTLHWCFYELNGLDVKFDRVR